MVPQTHKGSLWKVLGIYLAGSWIVLQVVDVLTQNMGLPPWVFSLALVLLVIGLPIVGATAYLQGLGASRPREPSPGGTAGGTRSLFTWRNAFAGGVAALGLWGIVATGLMWAGRDRPAPPARGASTPDLRSIAVLPFATRSSSEDDRYFSEGMHDDLLTQLTKIDSLKVISRTSVMQYAGSGKSIPEIARELGVATVLEGGVDRSGSRVRVNVQLIEAATDEHLWAETYDQELSAANVFAIRSDLAQQIATALRATLTPEDRASIEARPTESLEALDLYARGRYLFESRGVVGEMIEETLALFNQAIAVDSMFAPAWVGRANVFLSAWNWRVMSPEEARAGASASVERALALDPKLADAHVAASRVAQWDGRMEEAISSMEKALELNPGLADAHGRFGQLLEMQGRREEALLEARKAVDLDPRSIGARNLLSDRLWFARMYEASIAESRKVLEMEAGSWYAWYNIGWSEAMLRRTDEAVHAFRTALDLSPGQDETISMGLAYAFARAGQPDSALALIEDAPRESYDVSVVYFEAGHPELAFPALEEALRADPSQAIRILGDPAAEAMRADPRYDALIKRLGLK